MVQFTLLEKFKMLVDIILSSSFFLTTVIIGSLFATIMILSIRKKGKINRKIFILAWLFVIAFIFIRYFNTLFTMLDNLIENIFVSIYFPNLATYVALLLSTNFIFIYTIIKKAMSKFVIVLNTVSFISINMLFLFIADTVVKENIDIYTKLTIYSNSNLLILLELSTGLFTLWLFILSIVWIINKIISINKEPKLEEKVVYEKPVTEVSETNEILDNTYVKNEFEDIEIIDFEESNLDYENLFDRYMHGDSNLTIEDYKNIKEYLLKIKS